MGEGNAKLSLEGLAERLEMLERENARRRGKGATLEGRGGAEEKPEDAQRTDGAVDERVSRRAILTKAGAAAVAAVAAGTLLTPREAKAAQVVGDGDPGVLGLGGSVGVRGVASIAGVEGKGDNGVVGTGERVGFSGVYGKHDNVDGPGVTGDGRGNWPGVWGRNQVGDGVTGESSGSGKSGVYGRHNGTSGYGGAFEGGRAQLRLNPKGTRGRPTSGQHEKGEIYLDSVGALFVCTRSGTPGTWRKVTTTSA